VRRADILGAVQIPFLRGEFRRNVETLGAEPTTSTARDQPDTAVAATMIAEPRLRSSKITRQNQRKFAELVREVTRPLRLQARDGVDEF
jgi:hypothetical protein